MPPCAGACAQQSLSLQAQLLAELAAPQEVRGPQHVPGALAYFKQMKALEDQLAGEETKRSILQLEARYQTRQQQRIEVLEAQRQAQQQHLQARQIQERQLLATEAMLRGQDDERRCLQPRPGPARIVPDLRPGRALAPGH